MNKPKQKCKISRDISKRILCLHIYAELTKAEQNSILNIIKQNIS